jgi:hypothetical protein
MDTQQRIERIREMEASFNKVREAVASMHSSLKMLSDVEEDIVLLQTYQSSRQWLEDFEADERGEISKDLPRGVLSEDGLHDLLVDIAMLRFNLKELLGESE